eukprot:TRINITY_DN11094_c0_g3_i2.p1 TRINITY_DN11094_c0_g3~~TRINITY_DN11094_c0_g3_i2.p1  ORF type:complete len:193 (+),score=39.97 TRINITY_DN11094_c0_g3_i2:492-1070(+)
MAELEGMQGLSGEERFVAVMRGLQDGNKHKEEGNAALKEGNLDGATRNYHYGHLATKSAMSMVDKSAFGKDQKKTDLLTHADENYRALGALHISLLNNLTVVMIKKEKWEKAITYTTQVLDVDPSNVKALMRRAKAYIKLKKINLAEKDVDLGLSIKGDDAELLRMRKYLDDVSAHYDAKQKKAMQGWIDKM